MQKRLGDVPLTCQACQTTIMDDRDLGIYVRSEWIVLGRHNLNELKVVCRTCYLQATGSPIVYNIDV